MSGYDSTKMEYPAMVYVTKSPLKIKQVYLEDIRGKGGVKRNEQSY